MQLDISIQTLGYSVCVCILATLFHMQRYQYYVMEGISPSHVPDIPSEVLQNINTRLQPKLFANSDWKDLIRELQEEVKRDYRLNWQKAAVSYILMDPAERIRLRIYSVPHVAVSRVARAPIPWHETFVSSHETQLQQLFVSNPVMTQIQLLWWNK